MNPSKVIFLDVDGVLNDIATETKAPLGFIGLNDSMIKNLKKIVDITDAKVVLTSTWKSEWDENPDDRSTDGQYLNDKLEEFNIKIADKTTDKISDRGHGIRQYLANHPEIQKWIVLDDDIFHDYKECGIMPYLIHTSYYCGGLTEKLADKAIKKLEGT